MDADLLSVLEANFGRVKVRGDYAVIKSPFNPDDKNPSCVVALVDTDKFTQGFYKCFSTGRSGNIYSLLGIKHEHTKRKRALPQLSPVGGVKTHWSLMGYSKSEYLLSRGIPYDVQEQFRCYESNGTVGMPVFDRDGYLIYTVSRSVSGKSYSNSGPTNGYPAFTHAVLPSDLVFVVESMIDALTLFTVGFKAIALNSAGNHSRLSEFFKYHIGKIVLALDPDMVGQENANMIFDELSGKDVVNCVLDYDVNECWTRMLSAMDFDEARSKFRVYLLAKSGIKNFE